ncbi:septum formation family protein [Actinoplanes sp. URMC 104]|uniref:septum formation family protein n=1 Tax=Actinoplanes sp. URMC 104 TaxID=3423409 RepID=UPI003F1D725C
MAGPTRDQKVAESASDTPSPERSPAGSIRARAFDAAALLGTVALVLALAQLPAWRAAFSTIAAVALAALIFAVRYARGRWKIPLASVLAFVSLGALVTVYLQPQLTGSSAEPAPGPATSAGPPPRVAMAALQPGDCISGSDLRLADSNANWPSSTTVVPCDQPHDGEVIMSSDPWERNAAFPGEDRVDDVARERCREAFRSYLGVEHFQSIYEYVFRSPPADLWKQGDRHVYCVAYDPKATLQSTLRRVQR